MNLYLLSDFTYQGETLPQVFADGAWLDFRNIPILNTDTSKPIVMAQALETFFADLITAAVVCYMFSFVLYSPYPHPSCTLTRHSQGIPRGNY